MIVRMRPTGTGPLDAADPQSVVSLIPSLDGSRLHRMYASALLLTVGEELCMPPMAGVGMKIQLRPCLSAFSGQHFM